MAGNPQRRNEKKAPTTTKKNPQQMSSLQQAKKHLCLGQQPQGLYLFRVQ